MQLGQLVFQLVDLVGGAVQIATKRGGFFLGLDQLGAELVGLAGFDVVLGGLGEKCLDGACRVRLGPDGHDHGERLVVDVGQGGGDRGRGAELGGGVKRVNELCVIDRGEIGVGVVVAGGGGLPRLDRERGTGQRLGGGDGADGIGEQLDQIELVRLVLVLAVLVERPRARLAAGQRLDRGGVLRRVHGAEKKAVANVDRAVLGDLA